MTYILPCPNCGFRFPVNPKKHLYRRERYCPRCKTPTNIRPSRWSFLPSPNWFHQRAEQTYQRTMIKEMRRREPKQPSIVIPAQIPETLLGLSMLIRKREMELKEKEGEKKE